MSTLGRQNPQAHGMKLAYRRAHKAEHDVQVVDHQVQHHVDVQRAAVEDAEAVGFEKHRPVDQRLGRGDRGVEALQQAYLQDLPAGCRLPDQGIGLGQGDGDGLFQQDIESLGQSLGGHGIMRGGGHADGDRVQVQFARAARLQARFRRGKDGEVSLLAQHLGRGRIGIRNRGQPHPETGLLQLAIDAQMIAAKGAGAEDGDAESCSLLIGTGTWKAALRKSRSRWPSSMSSLSVVSVCHGVCIICPEQRRGIWSRGRVTGSPDLRA